MFTERHDFLIQMIERLVAGIVAQVRRARGGDPQELVALERECDQALAGELHELHERLRALDARSAAAMIHPVLRLRRYGAVLGGRAVLQAQRAQDPSGPVDAAALRRDARRALELLLEATLASEVTDVERSLCPLLVTLVDTEALAPRYLEALVIVGNGG